MEGGENLGIRLLDARCRPGGVVPSEDDGSGRA